jgi:hypothetical protein
MVGYLISIYTAVTINFDMLMSYIIQSLTIGVNIILISVDIIFLNH